MQCSCFMFCFVFSILSKGTLCVETFDLINILKSDLKRNNYDYNDDNAENRRRSIYIDQSGTFNVSIGSHQNIMSNENNKNILADPKRKQTSESYAVTALEEYNSPELSNANNLNDGGEKERDVPPIKRLQHNEQKPYLVVEHESTTRKWLSIKRIKPNLNLDSEVLHKFPGAKFNTESQSRTKHPSVYSTKAVKSIHPLALRSGTQQVKPIQTVAHRSVSSQGQVQAIMKFRKPSVFQLTTRDQPYPTPPPIGLDQSIMPGPRLTNEPIPDEKLLDMVPAKGIRVYKARLKKRLCSRNVLVPEGPKYDSKGRKYLEAFVGKGKRSYKITNAPAMRLPRCCNCCKKSVLGCE